MDFYDFYNNYDYYGYDHYGSSWLDWLGIFAGAMIVVLFIILAVVLVLYILHSIGIMTLARNRGLANPWLVWIPYVGSYTVGAIADDVNAREGSGSYFRYILLALSILNGIFSWFVPDYSSLNKLTWVVWVAFHVVSVVALNRIFKCYRPYSSTSWTVLCAIPFLAFLKNIFPFVIRNARPNWINPPGGYGHYNGSYPDGGYDPREGYPFQEGAPHDYGQGYYDRQGTDSAPYSQPHPEYRQPEHGPNQQGGYAPPPGEPWWGAPGQNDRPPHEDETGDNPNQPPDRN